MKLCPLLTIYGLLFTSLLSAQALPGDQRVLAVQKLDYLVTLPEEYKKSGSPSPLILFLHGGDGSNTKHNPRKYADRAKLDFPFIVVAPHCNRGCRWSGVDFNALLDEVISDYNVDESRIYITGYSMGGYGTWSAISKFPDRIAAAAPIAGGGDTNTVCNAKGIAIRAYHGDKDSVTPYSGSKRLIKTLEDCGAKPELLTIKGGDHWIWPDLFQSGDFYSWFLKHSKKN